MSYNLLAPFHFVQAASMGASVTSSPVEIKLQDNVGIQLKWTGTPVGSFAFQVSMNYAQDSQGNITNAGDWIALTLSPAIAASGSADSAYVDFNQLSSPWMRIVYTRASGTGSLDGWVIGKGV